MQVTAEVKKKIHDKLTACIALAEVAYKTTIPLPRVIYTKRGSTSGEAILQDWTINLNPALLMRNVETFLETTVPHEFAHLIVHQLWPQAHLRTRGENGKWTKRDFHGSYWQSVMHALGANPKRCHSYDVTGVANRRPRYQYKCAHCGASLSVSIVKHNRLKENPRAYRHGRCGSLGRLIFDDPNPPSPATPTRTTAPVAGSKLEQCLRWYRHYKAKRISNMRQMCIAVFVQEVGMTPAGASTYFQRCKELDS